MTPSALGSVSLGYQLLWNPLRRLRGVQLFVGLDDTAVVDARHLLSAIEALWTAQAPILLLSIQSARLLADILDNAPASSPWIEVHDTYLRDPAMAQKLSQAHRRGLRMIWRGEPGQRPGAALAPCFLRTILSLTAEEALAGLRVSLRKHNGSVAPRPSPVRADQIYESVASRVLAEHCLDEQGAWAVAGWPVDEVLHGYRQKRIQPGRRALVQLIAAIDADDSLDHLEQSLSDEPILAYCFVRYINSAGLCLRTEIESIRHGLMVLGVSEVRAWLQEQLPHANSDLNLQPVRTAIALRARLTGNLLDAGQGDNLRREISLCGLLSQIDLLLGEPLHEALARLQLPTRITSALLSHSGPYVSYLDIAAALESSDTQATRALCAAHEMDLENVNRTLLRTLSQARQPSAKGLLLV